MILEYFLLESLGVLVLGFRAEVSGFRVQGLRFRVQDLGFRI